MNLKKIALVSIAAAFAAAPVLATCVDPAPTFGQLFASAPWCPAEEGGLCAVVSQGTSLQARFWGQTQGNFNTDNATPSCTNATCGADNGAWQPFDANSPWILAAGTAGHYWIGSDWNAGGADASLVLIDGCPTFPTASSPIMLIGLSDSDPAGNGYWAVAWARNVPGAKGDYEFSTVNKTAAPNDQGLGAGNIILRAAPRPGVVASSRLTSTSHSFTLNIPTAGAISNALYGDNSLTESQVITGVKIYQRIVPRGTPAATVGNDRSQWTSVAGPVPLGSGNQTFTVNCATNSDVYFSYGFVGDSGFEAARVGTRRGGQCGPNLAEPGTGHGKKPISRNPKANQ